MRAFLAFAAAWILALSTYGGVTPWARCGIFAVLLLGTLWVERGRPPALPWVGLAAMGLAVAQIIPLPVFLLPRLQAEAHLLHGHTWGTISLSPNATIVEAITLLSYLMAGTLGYRAVRQGLPLERAFLAAGTIGVAFSAYAIIALVGHHDSLLVWGRRLDLQSATGPFVNRNHFAGFLELLLPPALALTIVRLQRARREGRSAPLTDTFWQSLALGLGVVVMLTALVLSRSRLGILSCAAGLLLMPALWRLRSAAQAIVCAGAAAVALSAWIGLGPLLERISATAEDAAVEKGRFLAWESTLRMTMAHPLAGVGLGAFPAAFAPYHPEGLSARFRHPHNEILAVGAEMGLPVLIALLAWLIRCGRTAWKQAVSRRDPYAVALLSAISAIVFHSLGDFNLRIPANGLLFSMWVGMAIALLTAQPSPAPRRIAARCVSSALLIPATAWAVSLLVVGEAPANPAEALSDLRRAATLEPFSGALHWREALALKALGRQEEADREMAFAARCDPTHPDLQFKIGTYFWSRYAVSSQPELRDHAIAAFRRGDVERALRYLAREGATPTDLEEVAPAGSPDLAELRIRSGAREEVIDAFVKTRPTDEAYDRLAKAALEIGWTAGAIRLLEERLRIRDEVDAWLLLSSCWAQIGEWENARRAADGARRTDPNRPEVHVAYARACLELGDPGAAVETLAEAVRLRPEVFEYRWDYARALLRVGRRTEAERVLRDLSRMTQTSREQVVALARLCLEAGFKETAREALERSLSRFPEDDEIRALLLEALDR